MAMTKAEMRKEREELMAAYDELWATKERYKKLFQRTDTQLVNVMSDIKDIVERNK
jgi:hypothetical protein